MDDDRIMSVKDLRRRLGPPGRRGFDAVQGVSFSVRRGELFAAGAEDRVRAGQPAPCPATVRPGRGALAADAGPARGDSRWSVADFFTATTLTGTSYYALAVIEHATRRIRVLGVTAHPSGAWVTQMARNQAMDLQDAGAQVMYPIRDRDTQFTTAFDAVLAGEEVGELARAVDLRGVVRNPGAVAQGQGRGLGLGPAVGAEDVRAKLRRVGKCEA